MSEGESWRRFSFPRRWAVWPTLAAVAIFLVFVGGPVTATRYSVLTIEELAREATLVVCGRVAALEVRRDDHGRIYSVADLTLSDVWKGDPGSDVCRVVWGGGTLGETEVRATGQTRFSVGDEIVAYLVRAEPGTWTVVGMAQGRFEVILESATGRRWVRNLFWGGRAEAEGRGRSLASWPPARPLDLEELKRRTREASK